AAIGSNGKLDLSFLPNQNGAAQITVRATDPGGLFADDVFNVTRNPVNNPPPHSHPIPDLTGNASSPPVLAYAYLNLVFHVVDNAHTELVYSIPSLHDALPIYAAIGSNGKLDLSFLPNQNGTAQITVRATDPGGLFADDVFNVT